MTVLGDGVLGAWESSEPKYTKAKKKKNCKPKWSEILAHAVTAKSYLKSLTLLVINPIMKYSIKCDIEEYPF